MTRRLAVVVSGFPRRSETFAVHELSALQRMGMLAGIYALKPGDDASPQPGVAGLLPLVRHLPGATADDQAHELARELEGQPLDGIHAYFAHAPAAVAERASARLGVPFGFSVHAKDARKVERVALVQRAKRAACVVACNHDVAGELAGTGAAVRLVPHGVDLVRFTPKPRSAEPGLRVLAVGRLVEKKGFHVLVDAIAASDRSTTLRIVGDGPEGERLRRHVGERGVADRVTFAGSATHATLPREYAGADVVAVPSIVDHTGDRDGLPNVVLEAMASGRPVVGTRVGAIDHAIRDGETGLLVGPGSPAALAGALSWLAANPLARAALGRRARAVVEDRFDLGQCVRRFAGVLEEAYA